MPITLDPWNPRNYYNSKRRMERIYRRIVALADLHEPIELLSQLSLAFLTTSSDETPDINELGINQAKLELLAWIVLKECDSNSVFPVVNGPVIEHLMSLAIGYILEFKSAKNYEITKSCQDQDSLEADLLHTSIAECIFVRGIGLPYHLKQLSRELYQPHKEWMLENLGFDIEQAISIIESIQELINQRIIIKRQKAKRLSYLLKQYYLVPDMIERHFDDNIPFDVSFITRSVDIDKDSTRLAIYYTFSNVEEITGFTEADIANKLNNQELLPVIKDFFNAFALNYGTTLSKPNPIGLNPLYEAPFVKSKGKYFLHLFPIAFNVLLKATHYKLYSNKSYRNQYDELRSLWQEEFAVKSFSEMAQVRGYLKLRYNAKGKTPAKHDPEIDGIIVFDNRVLLIEAKWKTVTREAREGNATRLFEDIKGSIGKSYEQLQRTQKYILDNSESVFVEENSHERLIINRNKIKEIYLMSILDYDNILGCIATDPHHLHQLGINDSNFCALPVNDLFIIRDIISSPFILFHYLDRRSQIMKDGRFLIHDELDFLGGYFNGMLDVNRKEFEDKDPIWLDGLDTEIQKYMYAKELNNGGEIIKPKRDISPFFEFVLNNLENIDIPGKVDVALAILDQSDKFLQDFGLLAKSVAQQTIADGKRHDVFMSANQTKGGINFVSTNNDVPLLRKTVEFLSRMNKYKSKSDRWIGIGQDMTVCENSLVFCYFDDKWKRDKEYEKLLEL